jgi:hypothetical protein
MTKTETKTMWRSAALREKIEFMEILLDAWLQTKFDTNYVRDLRARLSRAKMRISHMK